MFVLCMFEAPVIALVAAGDVLCHEPHVHRNARACSVSFSFSRRGGQAGGWVGEGELVLGFASSSVSKL